MRPKPNALVTRLPNGTRGLAAVAFRFMVQGYNTNMQFWYVYVLRSFRDGNLYMESMKNTSPEAL